MKMKKQCYLYMNNQWLMLRMTKVPKESVVHAKDFSERLMHKSQMQMRNQKRKRKTSVMNALTNLMKCCHYQSTVYLFGIEESKSLSIQKWNNVEQKLQQNLTFSRWRQIFIIHVFLLRLRKRNLWKVEKENNWTNQSCKIHILW